MRIILFPSSPFFATRSDQKVVQQSDNKVDLTPGRQGSVIRRRLTFLGFSIFLAKTIAGNAWKIVFKTDSKRFGRARKSMQDTIKRIRHRELAYQAHRINTILRGHFNYYGIAGNMERIHRFQYLTTHLWLRFLGTRSQRGRVTWEGFETILKDHPLRQCRLKIPYNQLSSYVRL